MRLILLTLLFIPILLLGQDTNVSKEKFPAFNLGIGNSDKKLKNWGNYHFDNGIYSKAIKSYEKLIIPILRY